jgi:lantibiotic biosynthesis protein
LNRTARRFYRRAVEEIAAADLFDVAAAIGAKLCACAQWDARGRSCRWKDARSGAPDEPDLSSGDLYGGSAGIALFLAQLHSVVPDEATKRAALGGLAHAIAFANCGASGDSFFLGASGVAYAAYHAGEALCDPALKAQARVLAQSLACPGGGRLDVISGAAGMIIALLALHRVMPSPELVEKAVALGEDMCARADWSEDHCSWAPMDVAGFESGAPLAGLSHGASGLALALMRLFEVSRRPDFLLTARGAYAYEDTLFDPASSNWLDMRFARSREDAAAKGEVPAVWCHGAGGIALSRSEALRIDVERAGEHRHALDAAERATCRALAHALASTGSDATPCHGITGLCEILSLIDPLFEGEAVAAAQSLAAAYRETLAFPSGLPDAGHDESLMLGDAGVGHVFLRLARPKAFAPVLLPV